MSGFFLFYAIAVFNISVEIFPKKFAVLKNHVSVVASFLRNGNRTRIHINNAVFFLKFRDMGVSGKDKSPGPYGRKSFVAVDGEHFGFVDAKKSLFAEHGKFQNHLVNLGVAVSADTKDIFLYIVEHGDDFFRRITFGQIVAWAVIKDIAEQKDFICVLIFKSFEKLFAVKSASVDIGCYHKFHKGTSIIGI